MQKHSINSRCVIRGISLTCPVLLVGAPAWATTYEWKGTTDTSWQTGTNWGATGQPASGAAYAADGLQINNGASGGNRLTYTSAEGTTSFKGLSLPSGQLVVGSGVLSAAPSSSDIVAIGGGTTANNLLTIDGGTLSLGGSVYLNNQSNSASGPGSSSTITVKSGTLNVGWFLSQRAGAGSSTVNLDGGLMTVELFTAPIGTANTFNFNGGTLKNGSTYSWAKTGSDYSFRPNTANVRDGGAILEITKPSEIVTALTHSNIDGDHAVDGGLTKLGASTLYLLGNNTYTGDTTINAGTLALGRINGAYTNNTTATIANSGTININGGKFNTSILTSFSVVNGQTLKGQGDASWIASPTSGATSIAGGGTLQIGQAHGTGATASSLGVTGTLALTTGADASSSSVAKFDLLNTSGGADKLAVSGALTYGGYLAVSNQTGTTLTAGKSWDLFDPGSQSGAFANVFGTRGDGTYLPTLSSGKWAFNYGTGVLSVAASNFASVVADQTAVTSDLKGSVNLAGSSKSTVIAQGANNGLVGHINVSGSPAGSQIIVLLDINDSSDDSTSAASTALVNALVAWGISPADVTNLRGAGLGFDSVLGDYQHVADYDVAIQFPASFADGNFQFDYDFSGISGVTALTNVTVLPEPAMLSVVGAGAIGLLQRRRPRGARK